MNTANRLKVGDLVTFVFCTTKMSSNFDFGVTNYDPHASIEIVRKAYARRILKTRGDEVQVNFEGRKMFISQRNVQKVWV